MSSKKTEKTAEKLTKKNMERLIRKRVVSMSFASAASVVVITSVLLWYLLDMLGLIECSTYTGVIIFIGLPLAFVMIAVYMTGYAVAERAQMKQTEMENVVQRIITGGYDSLKLPEKIDAEHQSVYDGLGGMAAMLAEKDSHIEGANRRCQLVEREQENEICRRLSAKVNPEMLGSLLTGIRAMAQEGRTEEIVRLLDKAAQIVDASREDGVTPRPIAHELGRIKRYLEIYETIYKRRIGYRLSVMCNIVGYRIMPNLILPVVQLLLERSMDAQVENYELSVEVTSSFNNLLVIVRDNNGLTSEEDFTYLINDDTTSANADGPLTIGALNRRISAGCGEKYSLKLSATKLGTAVYIYLPPPGQS